MPTTTPNPTAAFWRCRRCGTPNPRAGYLTRCLGCGRPIPPDSPTEATPAPVAAVPGRRRGGRTLAFASLYAVALLVALVVIRRMALGWWAVSTLIFMPRWLLLAPILPMAIGAARSRRAAVAAVVLLDATLVAGPVMGFAIPWDRLTGPAGSGPRVRIMTFNQGSGTLDVPRLVRYLERQEVDVLCFQEPGPNPALDAVLAEGWHVGRSRRIASRYPIAEDFGRSVDVNRSDERYTMILYLARLRHPDGFDFLVGSAHLPAPRRGFNRLRAGDVEGFRRHLAWWDEEAARMVAKLDEAGGLPLLVGGDFNMPADYAAMAAIRQMYPSAFEAAGWGYGYTRPTGVPWVRIDHILGSRHWAFARAWIGPDLGSDHLPAIAEATLRAAGPGG